MRYVVVDTDVASGLVRGRLVPGALASLAGMAPCVTLTTVAELTAWEIVRGWSGRSVERLRRWVDTVPVLGHDVEVAQTWGRLWAASRKAGRPAPQNDTWIAASCLVEQLPLLTLNAKDYAYFAEYHDLALLPTDG